MNPAATLTPSRSRALSYLSLFTSLSTLLCCALPSLLVLIGLGASVASLLSFQPWLVTLSRHKSWTFSVAGILIAASFFNMYYLAPKLQAEKDCAVDDPEGCGAASKASKILLWLSAALYGTGFFVAYILGPILARIDKAG